MNSYSNDELRKLIFEKLVQIKNDAQIDNTQDLSKEITERLEYIQSKKIMIFGLLSAIDITDFNKFHSADYIVIAAAQRTLSIIEGFSVMIKTGNRLCAIPLIRLQLDTAMRLNTIYLVKDYNNLVAKMFLGEPIRNIKSIDGNKLTDKYLHETLSKSIPGVTEVYNYTSDYIHLSLSHILEPISEVTEAGKVTFKINAQGKTPCNNSLIIEDLDVYISVLNLTITLCCAWYGTKFLGGEERRLKDMEITG